MLRLFMILFERPWWAMAYVLFISGVCVCVCVCVWVGVCVSVCLCVYAWASRLARMCVSVVYVCMRERSV